MEALKPSVLMGGMLLRHWLEGLTGAVCLFGALVLLVRRVNSRQTEKRLTLGAQNQRERSFQEAERAVLKYKHSHPIMDSAFILSLSLPELTERLQEGSLSAEEVFYVYMDKTLELQKKLNCCTGIILDSFEQLKKISSCKKGMLYGIPISLKENMLLKNQDSSCGVVKYLQQPAADDCVLVQVLKKQGAIPFVRTNIPQGLFSYECSNPIFGQTVNPYNVQKTSGGSSGGEGALIGGGGSVLGVGGAFGGSLRIPASFCGICALKPTAGRLSSKGVRSMCRGQNAVLSTPGPMAKDVESLAVFMRAILCDDMFSLDPTVPPLPFNEEVYQSTKPLTIGYYDHLELASTSPSMTRAVQEVKVLLEQAGHTLVPFKPVRLHEIFQCKFLIADGGATLMQELKGSTIDPIIRSLVAIFRLPLWLRKVLGFFMKPLWPTNFLQRSCGTGSVAALWKMQASMEDYVNDTIAQWRRLKIDVVLCPAMGPALNLYYSGKLPTIAEHVALYNILNFSAGVIPVSTVTAQDESNLSHLDQKGQFNRLLKEAASGALGLPVAVQCVAPPWKDELCLRFMREVEQLVNKATNH